MTTITLPHIDYVQRAQLIEYIKSNNLKFEISEPDEKYNPEFVAKIKRSENSTGIKIKTEDLWK